MAVAKQGQNYIQSERDRERKEEQIIGELSEKELRRGYKLKMSDRRRTEDDGS